MKLSHALGALLVLGLTQGCMVAVDGPPAHRDGPPPHAPAHGHRAHYRYNYYPEVEVYFDLDRHLYFYLDSGWHSAPRLPRELRIGLGAPVFLDLDVGEPYRYHDDHRRAYPPGQSKKKYKKWK